MLHRPQRQASNSGYTFKTTARDGVLFDECADGRDCYKALECAGTGDAKLCLKVNEDGSTSTCYSAFTFRLIILYCSAHFRLTFSTFSTAVNDAC